MSLGAKMPPRLAAVVLPVGLLGFVVASAAAISFAVVATRLDTLRGDRRPARRVDARGAVPGPARRDRHRRRLARLRLLHGRDRALRLGGRRRSSASRRRSCTSSSTGRRSASPTTRRSSRSRLSWPALAIAPIRGDGAVLVFGSGRGRGTRPLQRQPASDQPRRQRQRTKGVRAGRAHQPLDHDPPVRADGLRRVDARRCSGSARRSSPRRSSARCSRSRSTSARRSGSCGRCGSRSPTRLTGLGNHRHFHDRLERELARLAGAGLSAQPLPGRHRRLQADQRPLRPPGRRQGARPAGDEPPPGRRGVPPRRRRVRDPAARTRRGRRTDRSRGDHRADRRGRARARRARHDQRRHRDRARRTSWAATSSSGARTALSTGPRSTARTRCASTGPTWSRSPS